MSTGIQSDGATAATAATAGTMTAPVARTAPPPMTLRAAVLDALRGRAGHHDYTQGDLGHAIMLLAVPMVLEMVLESVFAVTDIFVAGRLGPQAIATIGITESMLTIIYTLAMGLGIAA